LHGAAWARVRLIALMLALCRWVLAGCSRWAAGVQACAKAVGDWMCHQLVTRAHPSSIWQLFWQEGHLHEYQAVGLYTIQAVHCWPPCLGTSSGIITTSQMLVLPAVDGCAVRGGAAVIAYVLPSLLYPPSSSLYPTRSSSLSPSHAMYPPASQAVQPLVHSQALLPRRPWATMPQ
jgi:hypothetical protein